MTEEKNAAIISKMVLKIFVNYFVSHSHTKAPQEL